MLSDQLAVNVPVLSLFLSVNFSVEIFIMFLIADVLNTANTYAVLAVI